MDKELEDWYKLHKFYSGMDYLTKDLAECLRVSTRTIQRWIKGRTTPNKEKLSLIKEYLSIKAEEINSIKRNR